MNLHNAQPACASPAKAGVYLRPGHLISDALDHSDLTTWTPAFAGEAWIGVGAQGASR
ncbi:hypothetical protein [Sphingomonas sp.]|jgi:hypothetical protein|uniref:hypothetical protein n=1 Tax=Sphingomonas sp. TaxID=28214 RepID=UPI002E36B3D2|nr:hypothetical protein [Sphingomonas sp.]HEX4695570.1 hypothetical protein [Sphingomonas sp.]